MIVAAFLLLGAQAAPVGPPPAEAEAVRTTAEEQERQEEAQVNYGHAIALPDLASKYPIGKVHRLLIVNNTGQRVTIEGADYPGRHATELLARTLRPGGRATLTLIAPPWACRLRLATEPDLAMPAFDLCRHRTLTIGGRRR
ncbi:MAG: hypothetical protein QOE79_2153 [Sphingomonadales bacterium]|jgi:hypothetical protein|nr:hypothetical protein [Sphingomonadales bacterium]